MLFVGVVGISTSIEVVRTFPPVKKKTGANLIHEPLSRILVVLFQLILLNPIKLHGWIYH